MFPRVSHIQKSRCNFLSFIRFFHYGHWHPQKSFFFIVFFYTCTCIYLHCYYIVTKSHGSSPFISIYLLCGNNPNKPLTVIHQYITWCIMFIGVVVLTLGVMLSLPDTADKLKNSIAKLFESWWSRQVYGREELGINTFTYLLERSLQNKSPVSTLCNALWFITCSNLLNIISAHLIHVSNEQLPR